VYTKGLGIAAACLFLTVSIILCGAFQQTSVRDRVIRLVSKIGNRKKRDIIDHSSSTMEAFHTLTRQIRELVFPSTQHGSNSSNLDRQLLQYRRQLNQMIYQNPHWNETRSVEIVSARLAFGLWEIIKRQPPSPATMVEHSSSVVAAPQQQQQPVLLSWIGDSLTRSFQLLMNPEPGMSLLELILDPQILSTTLSDDYYAGRDWYDPSAIFRLPEILAKACRATQQKQQQQCHRVATKKTKQSRYNMDTKEDAWQIAYVYILARLVYDETTVITSKEGDKNVPMDIQTLQSRIESFFQYPFRNSEPVRVGIILFWMDLFVDNDGGGFLTITDDDDVTDDTTTRCPIDLTLEFILHGLSAPRYASFFEKINK
jgi:hypothetical protein